MMLMQMSTELGAMLAIAKSTQIGTGACIVRISIYAHIAKIWGCIASMS